MNAVRHLEALKNPLCHIDRIFNTQSAEEIMKNRLRVLTTVKAIRWLTLQGCALRGHDESSTSENRGNFIELVIEFTLTGFNGWKRVKSQSCPLLIHMGMGCPTSIHMNAVRHLEALKNPLCHIDRIFNTQSAEEIMKNRLRVLTTVKAIRWLTLQGCALRGHDESSTSENRGNFIELVSLMGDLNDDIGKFVLKNAPKNAMYTSHQVQKEILHLMANKVRESIRAEIGEVKFCILVDEAKDASNKEQMAIVLRFVDENGLIQEKFFEIVHVRDTKAETLKDAISNV